MARNLNRREFLNTLGSVSAGIALAPNVLSQRRKRSAVIIGAGFAGLAAAYKLKSAGWNATVLEARDRMAVAVDRLVLKIHQVYVIIRRWYTLPIKRTTVFAATN